MSDIGRRQFRRSLAREQRLEAITPPPYLVDGVDPMPPEVAAVLEVVDAERAEGDAEWERHRAMHEDSDPPQCSCEDWP